MADTTVEAASRRALPEDDGLPAIELVGVDKAFSSAHGDVRAVEHVDLRIAEGEFFSLLGPSGCGKTTTLRMVAGFEEPTSGQILLHGRDMVGVPPYRRDVNMVFQQYALFPHMDVFENVAFGLRRKKVPKDEIKRRVTEALHLVELEGRERRRPGSSPAASSSASPWPGRWSTGRGRCCSTSRSAPSTSSSARRCSWS
jgi:spermidine/putrescine transport system ATP-binding protein